MTYKEEIQDIKDFCGRHNMPKKYQNKMVMDVIKIKIDEDLRELINYLSRKKND